MQVCDAVDALRVSVKKWVNELIVDLIKIQCGHQIHCANAGHVEVKILCRGQRNIKRNSAQVFAIVGNAQNITTTDVGSDNYTTVNAGISLYEESWASSWYGVCNINLSLQIAL